MGLFSSGESKRIRYAVVGLGHIAQTAVLPAFAHAKENSELAALVSDDPLKLKELGKQYSVDRLYSYDEYDKCLASGDVDAVYIALPNHLHCEYTVRAAQAGVHVLCEKPMAITEEECQEMIAVTAEKELKLMIAYRLHFEEANLKAIEIARSGELGQVKVFTSVFTLPVKADDIRVQNETGGGTLYDIGVYCINAARYIFQAEPSEVVAFSANSGDPKLREVDETTSAVLRFPGGRLASFTTSFGVAETSSYRIVGTKRDLVVDPAYDYQGKLRHVLTVEGKSKETSFSKRDHFAPELIYFSNCILENKAPEPSGEEGLADIRIVRALYESSQKNAPVKLGPFAKGRRPSMDQHIKRRAVSAPQPVNAESPTGGA